MHFAIVSCVAFITIAVPSFAMDAKGNYTVLGQGNASCGRWIEEHKTPNNAFAAVQNAWVLGFVTGFNRWDSGDKENIADGTDSDGIIAWISKDCAENPLNDVAITASRLIRTLRERGAR